MKEVSLEALNQALQKHDQNLASAGPKESDKRIKPAGWAILEEITEVCQKHHDFRDGLRGESRFFTRFKKKKREMMTAFMVVRKCYIM